MNTRFSFWGVFVFAGPQYGADFLPEAFKRHEIIDLKLI